MKCNGSKKILPLSYYSRNTSKFKRRKFTAKWTPIAEIAGCYLV